MYHLQRSTAFTVNFPFRLIDVDRFPPLIDTDTQSADCKYCARSYIPVIDYSSLLHLAGCLLLPASILIQALPQDNFMAM